LKTENVDGRKGQNTKESCILWPAPSNLHAKQAKETAAA